MKKSNNIRINGLTKTFEKGSTIAIDDISFDVEHGELIGIIGPDGAGKTTLFRVLCTLLLPDKGSAKICGFDLLKDFWQIRQLLGYMPGKFSLYQDLTIEENLQFFASVFGTTLEANHHLINDIYKHIKPFKDRNAGKLSGGMKQKLALCCAMVHEPRVLILDEPTTGVDPVSRREFWDILDGLKAKGITILVSTPYMDEAARCDRIALMQDSKIMEMNTFDNIISKYNEEMFAVKGENMYQLLLDLREFKGTKSCYAFGESLHLKLNQGYLKTNVPQYLKSRGHIGVHLYEATPNIEDIFIELSTNKNQ